MLWIVIALMLSALIAPAILGILGKIGFFIISLVPLSCLGWIIDTWATHDLSKPIVEHFSWIPELGLNFTFVLDQISALLSCLILIVGCLVLWFCVSYFDEVNIRLQNFAGEMVGFTAVMVGLVSSRNMLLMYVFWELTSVLSFLLVGFYSDRAVARRAANQALLITSLGGLSMLTGIVMLGVRCGSFEYNEWLHKLSGHDGGLYTAIALFLMLLGAVSKSAIVPLHFWLPGAMAAPTPVSAFLHAAAMVKAGVFLIVLLNPIFHQLWLWKFMTLGLGLLTMFIGAWQALHQYDLKLLLAHGTVSQLGFMFVLAGASQRLVVAGLLVLSAHAFFKSTLFLVVGVIDHSLGTRDIRKISGLGRKLPWLAFIGLVGSLSMAGFPLTFGFLAKEFALNIILTDLSREVNTWFAFLIFIGVSLGSLLTCAYSVRFWFGAFGDKRKKSSVAVNRMHAPNFWFYVSPTILAGFCLGLGVFTGFADWIVQGFEKFYELRLPHIHLWSGFNLVFFATLIILVGGFLFARTFRRLDTVLAEDLLGESDRIFDLILRELDVFAGRVTRFVQRGSLSVTVGTIMLTFSFLSMGVLFIGNGFPKIKFENLTSWEIIMVFIMVICALTTVVIRNRLAGALLIGVTGYCCVGFFIFYGAPDLALTQAACESLILVVYILGIRKFGAEIDRSRVYSTFKAKIVKAIISISAGTTVVILTILAISSRSQVVEIPIFESLPRPAYLLGHASNTVNAIIVDIRLWDTLGETAVLLIAATGVVSLVFRNERFGSAPKVSDATSQIFLYKPNSIFWLSSSVVRLPKNRSLVMEITTRVIFPALMMFSVYLLFTGFNDPGGGFSAGLVGGLGLVLRYIAGGRFEIGEVIRYDSGKVIGIGFILSGLGAAWSILSGIGVVSAEIFAIKVWLIGNIVLPYSLVFDAGVYLVVLGLVLDILRALGARLEVESIDGR